jgi:hypothetical protein
VVPVSGRKIDCNKSIHRFITRNVLPLYMLTYLSLHPGKGFVQQISTEGCPLLVDMTSAVAATMQLIGFL